MPNLTKYSLDHEVRSSFEMGQLIPFLCQEVVPGDKYRVQSSTLVRLQPMLSPLMHRLDYFQRYYYVPYRLLIPHYEQLLTDPDSKYVVPSMDKYLQYTAKTFKDLFAEKPLLEYFGLATSNGDSDPTNVLKDLNATPLLAYYLIYNHYYMRSDLDKRYVDQLRPENFESAELRKYIGDVMNVNEGLDYFTSAKTSTQYGNMVQLDMNGDNTITVPEMRLAERLQSFRERLLRVGGKYVNYIKEFFGVEPLDARVQIPKYLGGDSYVLNVSDVDQTAPSELGSVGESYGKSVSVNRTGQIQYDVYEHGLIIGLHFVRPRPSNIGGCPKLFTRRNYFDFFNPHFSALGYQEIEGRELDVTRPKDEAFGYVPRYDDYRYGNDVVSGDFRRSLNFWHLSRDISKERLSVPFVTCRPDPRIFSYEGDNGRVGFFFFTAENSSYKLKDGSFKAVSVEGFLWMPMNSVFVGSKIRLRSFKDGDQFDDDMTIFDETFVIKTLTLRDSTAIEPEYDSKRKETKFQYSHEPIVETTVDKVFSMHDQEGNDYKSSDILIATCGDQKGTFIICVASPLSLGTRPAVTPPDEIQSMLEEIDRLRAVEGQVTGFADYHKSGHLDNNHVLSVTYNNVDVLRPLARYDGNVLR